VLQYGGLGTETVTDSPGFKVWFEVLSIKNQFGSGLVTLQPGHSQQFQHDLEYVFCDGTVNRAQ
jgi:hypothetical protein